MSLSDLSKENYEYLMNEIKKPNSWVFYKQGNIFKEQNINVLIHQCNCFHAMNEGFAYLLSKYYPNIIINDKHTTLGDKNKLGSFSSSLEKHIISDNDLLILNLYAQYRPGLCEDNPNSLDSNDKRIFYLKDCLQTIAEFLTLYNIEKKENTQINIGVPWLIGCGKNKNNTNIVFNLFKEIFEPIKQYVKIIFIDFK